jgi:hypothetical protein
MFTDLVARARLPSPRRANTRRVSERRRDLSVTTTAPEINVPRLLLTRAETLAALRIGETTLFWLQRTGKLNPIRIGARVLFSTAEVEHLAKHGATLTEAEKQASAKRDMQRTEVA